MRVDDVASTGLADNARHVIGCGQLDKRGFEVRVDDVAGNSCLVLPPVATASRIGSVP
jgi:hypothetical protein